MALPGLFGLPFCRVFKAELSSINRELIEKKKTPKAKPRRFRRNQSREVLSQKRHQLQYKSDNLCDTPAFFNQAPMRRYQCHKCHREFARSDSLRRHLSSGVCKEDQKDTSESDEESVVSTKRTYGSGKDIFGKYDPDKLVEDSPTDNSTDDEEDIEDEDDEKEGEDEDDEDEGEEDIPRKRKKHKIRSWDILVNIAAENLQDTFNETVEETFSQHQNKDIQEAEAMAYEELKPNYLSQLISRYKYMVGMTAALKKYPVHQRIIRTAKRLRDEEEYDDDESMQYAIKKRKFLIERKLDEYDPPSYEEDEEQAHTQSLSYKAPLNTPPYKPINSNTMQ